MIKFVRLFFIFLFFLSFNSNIIAQCDITLESAITLIDGETLTILPGDVVCLEGGNKEFLLIQNVHGTPENPITFINSGGAVIINTDHFYGIKIAHSSYLRIMGNGVEDLDYGIQVQRVANGAGVSIDDLTTDIELAYTEIGNTLIAGLYAKTDPDCSFESSRDNFTMYNVNIHHNYIHHTGDEGLYIGHSKYEQGVYLADCDTTIYPHLIHGLKVHNNILEHLGWDGIQVACSDNDCSVYDNIIRYDSEEEYVYQMSGILIGGGARCDCYNNQIYDGKGDGIDVLGLGDFSVFNNLIVNAGRTFQPGNPNESKHGIYVGDVVTISNQNYKLFNNTIVSPKSYGITYNNPVAAQSLLYNNLIVDPGKKAIGESAYINNLTSVGNVDLKNNINVTEVANAGFQSPTNGNFELTASSSSVDFGKNLSSEGINFDLLNRPRPYNTYYDVGAYEYQGPDAIGDIPSDILSLGNIFPNPSTEKASIVISLDNSQLIKCKLLNSKGQQIQTFTYYCDAKTNNIISINLENLSPSLYLLEIQTENGVAYRKLMLQ